MSCREVRQIAFPTTDLSRLPDTDANLFFPCTPTTTTAGVPGVTWSKFILNNLIPVTLGNIVAGALCMATVYSLAYGSLGKKVWGK